ncbi:MAG: TauD/TfdA family dioxygenase [Parvularculaceae bacterium]
MLIRAATAKTNAPRRYDHIKAAPIAGTMGAEITGVDLRDLSEAAFREIEQALADHLAIFILDQDLSVEQLEAFTQRFGAFGADPFIEGMKDHPHVLHVRKEANEMAPVVFGGLWHSDWSFLDKPPDLIDAETSQQKSRLSASSSRLSAVAEAGARASSRSWRRLGPISTG